MKKELRELRQLVLCGSIVMALFTVASGIEDGRVVPIIAGFAWLALVAMANATSIKNKKHGKERRQKLNADK